MGPCSGGRLSCTGTLARAWTTWSRSTNNTRRLPLTTTTLTRSTSRRRIKLADDDLQNKSFCLKLNFLLTLYVYSVTETPQHTPPVISLCSFYLSSLSSFYLSAFLELSLVKHIMN